MFSFPASSFRKSLQALVRWLRRPDGARRPSRRTFRPEFERLEGRRLLSASITEFGIPTSGSGALDIARGPDGNQWFAEELGHKIAKITSSGSITEYAVSGDPVDLWAGTGNDLWFTELNANKVGKIDTSTGLVTEYTVTTSGAGPNGITLGADGAMWFAEYFVGKIGRITSDGQITEYTVVGNPTDLALGSDGNVWFTSYNTNQVGKITTAGVATYYAAPSNSGPAGIAAGSDGNLWVTEYNTGKVASVTTSGTFTEYSIPTANSHPWAINAGATGSLWFAESTANKIGRLTTTGTFKEYAVPTSGSDPRGIVAATNGSIWFTEYAGNKIGTITPQAPTITLSVTYGTQRTVTLSGQVTDQDPGGLTVTFTGKVTGSVTTNADGTYSGTFTATGLGDVQATTTNPFGLVSNTASVTLVSNAPVISDFIARSEIANVWIFTGRVTDESAPGLVVRFGGIPSLVGKTATVQADGTFELVVLLQPGESGTASAQTTDWWGLDSNLALTLVAP